MCFSEDDQTENDQSISDPPNEDGEAVVDASLSGSAVLADPPSHEPQPGPSGEHAT